MIISKKETEYKWNNPKIQEKHDIRPMIRRYFSVKNMTYTGVFFKPHADVLRIFMVYYLHE